MKLFKPSIRTFRERLASIDSAPQFAILGIASGFLTGLVIIAFRLAIEWPLDQLLEEGPESFETLDPKQIGVSGSFTSLNDLPGTRATCHSGMR